ncbi:hypothetical protein B7G54_11165 [Burkholderia puraquae]|uniref:Uncharacterized protein n=1 Tax=Burkholderia puraquae TaxID=1904757 RepID=A0A1X1PKW3_9BURK|nr:hypothetical protein [Burkholderia puraquae]ORT87004.1 hypothetical protein B7G54_11165 [Burkholderia puraquae]CAB3768837.1 hypothetical protein LMG29660_06208 [Burkholderia puraquae]
MKHLTVSIEHGAAVAFAQPRHDERPLGGALRYGCPVTDRCIGREATADALLHARNRLLARAG